MTGPERVRTLSAPLPQDVEESVADEDEELLEEAAGVLGRLLLGPVRLRRRTDDQDGVGQLSKR